MADDLSRDLERAKEEARRAREEAERLRQQARDLEHRLRDRSREERHAERERRREERPGPGFPDPPHAPHFPFHPPGIDTPPEGGPGARSEQTFSLESVREVRIEQTAGRLTVRNCTGDETPGVTSIGSKSAPRVDVRREGERLVIEIKQVTGWLFRRKQGATSVVRLAPGIASIDLNLGYGDAQVREIVCESIALEVGAGTLNSYSCRGKLRANVGAGKIAIYAHSGVANCDTGTGDLHLDLAEVLPGDYRINAGIGRAELRLPAGAQVQIRASSGIGRSKIDFPSAGDSAPAIIKIDTGIGEVNVRARDPDAVAPAPAASRPQRGGRSGGSGRRREAEELRVLQLLEQGRISSQEAADLIAALQGAAPPLDDDFDQENGTVDGPSAESAPSDDPPPPPSPAPFA